MCQTSISPETISVSITIASDANTACTIIIKVRRGTMSAVAPAKRARKLNPNRAAAVSPTRNGESVRLSTYQTTTTISICDPI